MSAVKAIADRLRGAVAEHSEPRQYVVRVPLRVQAWSCGKPASLAEAERAAYTDVPIGWRWGPVWSSAWFRLRVPPAAERPESVRVLTREEKATLSLRFSCGTEATLWMRSSMLANPPGCEGEPAPKHGFDVNHTLAPAAALQDAWTNGPAGEDAIYIEAACNRPLGASTFFWDDAAEVARWKEELPGRLEFAELVEVHEEWAKLTHRLRFLAGVIQLCDEKADHSAVSAAVDSVVELLARHADRADIGDAAGRLADVLRRVEGSVVEEGPRSLCRAIGHAHIDTAWLWTLAETRRKCLRTFSSALRLMEANPSFRFLCTQPQQYEWVEEDSPRLSMEIRSRVREGRWEVGAPVTARGDSGAMWIEPDCNMPSGESLIRQFLLGTRYVKDKFGPTSSHAYVFLPDTFGFPGSMPQILVGCGVKTFIFNKLWWNESNPPTMSFFRWRGIDGTEVVSYLTPGMEYNATMTAPELRKGDANHRAKDPTAVSEWLQPFGFGDGGGGPTQEMIDAFALAEEFPGLPRVEFTRVDEFCERLHERRQVMRRRGEDLPVWPEAELYLERHRGTYTTQAWIKRANRRGEECLRLIELLIAEGLPAHVRAFIDPKVEEAWKLLLLNQFHDILPGSSIKAVYDDAREQYRVLDGNIKTVLQAITMPAELDARRSPFIVVVNPCSSVRSGVLELPDGLAFVDRVPAVGMRRLDGGGMSVVASSMRRPAPVAVAPLADGGYRLCNGVIWCDVSTDGTIRLLRRLGDPESIAIEGPLSVLKLYEDTPKYWEAWDIDRDYEQQPIEIAPPDVFEMAIEHPLRVALRVSRPLGAKSRITQWITLDAESPRVDVKTHVDWHEHRRLLRVEFPTTIRADNGRATYDIQFGHVQRSVSRDDPHGAARFEVCAHRWMDLSGELVRAGVAGRAGLAILNDGKYGHSCHEGTMGLTLLRSAKFPDETADMGEHEFTYSLMPHGGDWRAANVDVEAEALNRPLVVMNQSERVAGSWKQAATAQGCWSPFVVDASGCGGHMEIAAIKRAEDGDGIIVRLVETRGVGGEARVRWNIKAASVAATNLLEQTDTVGFAAAQPLADLTSTIRFRPFEVVTRRVRVGANDVRGC